MTKILEEVRRLSSHAIAIKQESAKNKMPDLINRIEGAARLGKTSCEFREHEIDEYSKKLLEIEGFRVYTTTRQPKHTDWKEQYLGNRDPISIWMVTW